MFELQERLKQMETQNQLINDEYAKLLREKEVHRYSSNVSPCVCMYACF